MIDIGFVNGGVETRYFITGLAPEAAIVDIKKCGWCGLCGFLMSEWPVQWGIWIALQEITPIWDLFSWGAATMGRTIRELGLWVHWMIKLSEMRKSMVK